MLRYTKFWTKAVVTDEQKKNLITCLLLVGMFVLYGHKGFVWTWLFLHFQELPAGEWFCCTDCSRIRRALQVFLHHGAELLPFTDANIIKKKRDSRGLNKEVDADIRWRLLSGRTLEADSKLLLSRAVTIFHVSDPLLSMINSYTNVIAKICFSVSKLLLSTFTVNKTETSDR